MLRPLTFCGLLCSAISSAHAGVPVQPFPGNDHSYGISASRDLRYVAFVSNASNLVAGDTNGRADVFVADRQLGTLQRASVNVDGIQTEGSSVWPSISNDGRYVVFDTTATNIGVAAGLVRKDLQTGAVALVAMGGSASYPSLSDSGAYAASDPQGFIRFHDIGAGTTINVTTGGFFDDGHPVISGDGRFVVFATNRNNLVAGDTNNTADIFRWDRLAPAGSEFVRVSVDSAELEPNGATPVFIVGARVTNAMRPIAVSANGSLVAFNSVATNLTFDAGGARGGLFLRNIPAGITTKLASCNACTAPFGNIFNGLDMSADGAYLSFSASASFFGGVPSAAQPAGYYVVTVATGALTFLGNRGPGQADIAGQFGTAIAEGGALAAIQTTNLPPGVDDRAQYADIVALTVPALATTLLSRASQGKAGDGHARQPALSDSGRKVVFVSDAGNLVAGDTNAYRDVFLRDLTTDTITKVSVGLGGVPTNGASYFPSISGDGQVIAFGSEADNLVAGDTPGTMDVFVRPAAGPIERVSIGLTNISGYSGLSQDGRYVAFANFDNVYLYDRVTQIRTLASLTHDALPPNANCNVCDAYRFSLSDDGRYLVFNARASNHVLGQAPPPDISDQDIFMYDRVANTLALVSRATGSPGIESEGTNLAPWISGDGRFVSWHSNATNLGGPANATGVYLRDMLLNTTVFVGSSPRPGTFTGMEAGPMVSNDGSHVTYLSTVGTIVPGDSNRLADVFLWKREDRTTRRISLSAAWSQANGSSYSVDASTAGFPRYFGSAVSADGAIAAFSTAATNLSAQDDNASDDVFVVDRDSQAISRVSAPPLPPGDEDRTAPAATANGGKVVMVQTDRSGALGGAPLGKRGKGIGDKWATVVLVDFATKDEVQIDVSSTEVPADGDSYFPAVAPVGDVVSFASDATNLGTALDTNASTDIFLRDVTSGTTVAITANANADSGVSATTSFGDKWGTTFESNATNLPGATSANNAQDVFIAVEGATQNSFTIEPVSVALGGGTANGPSGAPAITEDARFVAYSSLATNLIASDTNGVSDVYVRDRVAGTTTRVSLGEGGVVPNGASGQVSITGTGGTSWAATFESEGSNLTAGDSNAETDIFVRESAGCPMPPCDTEIISKGLGGAPANGKSLNPSISPDGQFVTFTSTASNLVASDTNNLPDVFLYDRVLQTTRRISVGVALQQADDYALRPSIGQTGGGAPVVVWDTAAENLVPGDSDDAIDVFLFDDGSGLLDSTNTVIFRSSFE